MAEKRPALGRGLSALIPETSAARHGPQEVDLDLLGPNRFQPRVQFDDTSLDELAQSIRAHGVIQPILVRRHGSRFEIIAGERRWRAAQRAGLLKVPVLVRDVPDDKLLEVALIENIQRENLNPLEEAQGLQRLTQEFGLTHEDAAKAVGRSRSAASNLLRLLNLAEPVQQMLMAGDIDMGHARALLALDKARQITHASEIVARKLSVREAERLVARAAGGARQQPLLRVKQPKSRDVLRLEEELSDLLTAPVDIRIRKRTRRGDQGEVTIAFGSLDELNGLIEKLRRHAG